MLFIDPAKYFFYPKYAPTTTFVVRQDLQILIYGTNEFAIVKYNIQFRRQIVQNLVHV